MHCAGSGQANTCLPRLEWPGVPPGPAFEENPQTRREERNLRGPAGLSNQPAPAAGTQIPAPLRFLVFLAVHVAQLAAHRLRKLTVLAGGGRGHRGHAHLPTHQPYASSRPGKPLLQPVAACLPGTLLLLLLEQAPQEPPRRPCSRQAPSWMSLQCSGAGRRAATACGRRRCGGCTARRACGGRCS